MKARKQLSAVAAAASALPMAASVASAETLYENDGDALAYPIWAELRYSVPYDDDYYDGIPPEPDIGYYDFDSEVADDFIVPEGDGWSIERVYLSGQVTLGFYSEAEEPPTAFNGTMSFAIHASNAGALGDKVADPACSAELVTPTVEGGGNLSFSLPTACFLEPGHYWLVAGADAVGDGFYGINVTAAGPVTADDQPLLQRSRCGAWYEEDTALAEPLTGLPASFIDVRMFGCSPFTAEPAGYPNVALKFGLEGYLGTVPPPEPDAGTPDAGTDGGAQVSDGGGLEAGVPDASPGGPDAGGEPVPDAAIPGEGDGGDAVDSGELAGGGCDCSTTSHPEQGLGTLSLAGLVFWLLRRRKRDASMPS